MMFRPFSLLLVGLMLGLMPQTIFLNTARAESLDLSANSILWICNIAAVERSDRTEWNNKEYAQPVVREAKRRGLSCGVGEAFYQSSITDDAICSYSRQENSDWAKKEAKRRGLSCGVDEASSNTQTASSTTPTSTPQALSEQQKLLNELADAQRLLGSPNSSERDKAVARGRIDGLMALLFEMNANMEVSKNDTSQQTISNDTKLPTTPPPVQLPKATRALSVDELTTIQAR